VAADAAEVSMNVMEGGHHVVVVIGIHQPMWHVGGRGCYEAADPLCDLSHIEARAVRVRRFTAEVSASRFDWSLV
jgi:hypothetical protein